MRKFLSVLVLLLIVPSAVHAHGGAHSTDAWAFLMHFWSQVDHFGPALLLVAGVMVVALLASPARKAAVAKRRLR